MDRASRGALNTVIVAIVAACAGSDIQQASITVRDSAGVMIVQHDCNLSVARCTVSANPDITIGGEASEDQQLYRVFGATRLGDGRIALVNSGSHQLRFYDRDGNFLHQVGRSGRGPGEFSEAFYLWVLPGDTIWVGDYPPFQFHLFAQNGDWIRTVRLRPESYLPRELNVLADGRAVVADDGSGTWQGSPAFQDRELTVVVHDRDGMLRDTLGTYPYGRWGNIREDRRFFTYALFESFTRLHALGSRLLIGHGSRPELFVYDMSQGTRLDRVIRWETDLRQVSRSDVDAERNRVLEQYANLDASARRRLLEEEFGEDRPVADYFPVFGSVMIGRDGRLWVREYRQPTAARPHSWLAFDATGRLQCRATIPAFSELLEFGPDYLLALNRDSLGVESVLQYRITLRKDSI